uniref:SH2 domain-containing protein n=1 Tax=Trichuris muris TaxID=70415 RepID=A0A5S6Q2Q7_TRIMR
MTENKIALGVIKVIGKHSNKLGEPAISITTEEKKIHAEKGSPLESDSRNENIEQKITAKQPMEMHISLANQSNTEECITFNDRIDQSTSPVETAPTNARPLSPKNAGTYSTSALTELDVLNIPVPLCKLPYYHYRRSVDELQGEITRKGDYLVFLNTHDQSKPTLYACDESNNVKTIPIKTDSKGHFIFHAEDTRERFCTIGRLIRFYADNKLNVQESRDSPCYLRRPIYDPEYQTPLYLENNSRMETWAYFHPISSPFKSIPSVLKRNGDYILFGQEENPNHHRFIVKWEDYLYILQFRPNKQGRWVLPRSDVGEPIETVESLDQLVKSYARTRAIVHGISFVRPIKTHQMMSGKQKDGSSTEASKAAKQLEDGGSKQAKMAPRPLHSLPIYFGQLSLTEAVSNLQESGEYLLYTNALTKNLMLAVRWTTENETMIYTANITKNKEGFFQITNADAELKFGTVDELITYYNTSHIPVQAIRYKEKYGNEIYLLKPVQRHLFCNQYNVHEKDDTNWIWCNDRIGKKKACELLKNSGDFLCRLSSDRKQVIITVRWNDKCYDLNLQSLRHNERDEYELPKYDDAEPTEYAAGIFDFVKIAVTSQMQLNGMILKNCIQECKP